MARAAGASLPSIAAAAKTFTPVEHRLELVREINGVAYYNAGGWTDSPPTYLTIDSDGVRIHEYRDTDVARAPSPADFDSDYLQPAEVSSR